MKKDLKTLRLKNLNINQEREFFKNLFKIGYKKNKFSNLILKKLFTSKRFKEDLDKV